MTKLHSKQHRVLVDLKIALNNGYCGIAKENRLVFKMLSKIATLQTEGLLVSGNSGSVFSNYSKPRSRAESIEQSNRFFHEALGHDLLLGASFLRKLKLDRLYALRKRHFDLFPIEALFDDVIWRNVFNKSLSVADRELLLGAKFFYTNMVSLHLSAGAYLKRKVYLNTSGYNAAIFLEPTVVSVSPGTTKIVRYHDTIPLTEPDFSGNIYSHRTLNMLNQCAMDSYFVCNSEPTRQALLAIRPELEAKAQTIPCAMSSNYKKVNNEETLRQIIVSRFSGLIVKQQFLGAIRKQILEAPQLNYIFNLATFDPKKNHLNLIRGWEKLNYQHPQPIKLVIAANRGWFSQETQNLMRPHIEMGNIIHLENLSVDDLPYLLSHAKAFVFPSFVEGFGLPPLEAMQCECPVIVSDIPAHRWVLGDAALFCNPYSADSIQEAMAQLLYLPGAAALRQDLAQKGLQRVKRYAEEVLQGQWAELFEKFK
jgi:glycosyltransferase involved in cell wall biosynthesis